MDERLVTSYVQPLLRTRKRAREDDMTDIAGDDDVDINAGANPFDD